MGDALRRRDALEIVYQDLDAGESALRRAGVDLTVLQDDIRTLKQTLLTLIADAEAEARDAAGDPRP